MVRWLKNPQVIIAGNAMPNMNLNDAQAPRYHHLSRRAAVINRAAA
jgi:hypothetical protein